MIEPDEKREIEGWDAPFDETQETSPRVKLARRIASTIKPVDRPCAVGDGEARHAVRPGDILVLVRQRGALFEAIIRALKNANIAVAGADRLVLTEHIAVMDLIALADALLLPRRRSRAGERAEEPAVRTDRGTAVRARAWSARARCARRCASRRRSRLHGRARTARSLCRWARQHSPFAFYARILGADQRPARFHARLGPEAADALDEFLEHALTMSARRRRPCRASSHGCAPATRR